MADRIEHVCGMSGFGRERPGDPPDVCPACQDASPFSVSTNDLTELQIAQARAGCYGLWLQYGSLAWVHFPTAEKALEAREHAKKIRASESRREP